MPGRAHAAMATHCMISLICESTKYKIQWERGVRSLIRGWGSQGRFPSVMKQKSNQVADWKENQIQA